MQKTSNPQPNTETAPTPTARRPYQRPAFITAVAFERQALSCGANLMSVGPLIDGCGLRS